VHDFMLQIHQKSCVGQAVPGCAREAYSAPPDFLAGSWGKEAPETNF